MNTINSSPCFNFHREDWQNGFDPSDLPSGPIELYEPTGPDTENLDVDANFEVEFRGEYPDMMTAINETRGEAGRFMWATPESGRYLGFLNRVSGSAVVFTY